MHHSALANAREQRRTIGFVSRVLASWLAFASRAGSFENSNESHGQSQPIVANGERHLDETFSLHCKHTQQHAERPSLHTCGPVILFAKQREVLSRKPMSVGGQSRVDRLAATLDLSARSNVRVNLSTQINLPGGLPIKTLTVFRNS